MRGWSDRGRERRIDGRRGRVRRRQYVVEARCCCRRGGAGSGARLRLRRPRVWTCVPARYRHSLGRFPGIGRQVGRRARTEDPGGDGRALGGPSGAGLGGTARRLEPDRTPIGREQSLGVGIAALSIEVQCPCDHPVDPRRHIRHHLAQPRGLFDGLARPLRPAEHLVRDGARGVHIGVHIGLGIILLELRRAIGLVQRPRRSQPSEQRKPGQPQRGRLGIPVTPHQPTPRGLETTVHDPVGVGCIQRLEQLQQQRLGMRPREATALRHHPPQSNPVEQLAREVDRAVGHPAAVEHRNDVGVLQGGPCLGRAQEPLHVSPAARQLGQQQLHPHPLGAFGGRGFVQLAHPTDPTPLDQHIALVEPDSGKVGRRTARAGAATSVLIHVPLCRCGLVPAVLR